VTKKNHLRRQHTPPHKRFTCREGRGGVGAAVPKGREKRPTVKVGKNGNYLGYRSPPGVFTAGRLRWPKLKKKHQGREMKERRRGQRIDTPLDTMWGKIENHQMILTAGQNGPAQNETIGVPQRTTRKPKKHKATARFHRD